MGAAQEVTETKGGNSKAREKWYKKFLETNYVLKITSVDLK